MVSPRIQELGSRNTNPVAVLSSIDWASASTTVSASPPVRRTRGRAP
jgi:hypothetical protein